MKTAKNFDILVVGGGHAGVEAAHIAAQFNLNVGILTMPEVPLASTPCNPSVGGVAKGQVVRELDALGGLMGRLADLTAIQYRVLNASKGYAVQSTRVQVDKDLYSQKASECLGEMSNIMIIPEKVVNIKALEPGFQLLTDQGTVLVCKKVIITAGTFLKGKLHCGEKVTLGGRIGSDASKGMAQLLSQIKMYPLRFKTGTPARLASDSVDWSAMEEQQSDPEVRNFHCLHDPFQRTQQQVSCYITRTNPQTMKIIRDNKERSPLFNGQIQGVGPRYCPSIEDKAYRYPDRDIHHIFIEPEGLTANTLYPNGISTSLPVDVQTDFIRSIKGLEKAEIVIPGYAVEYDVVDTTFLNACLEYSDIKGLYFAGQVNGTSGYEEAAGQGFIAGVNAALNILEKKPLILSRYESYIGVMIEDLISNQRDEPYRLFTARSENRLYLREDNSLLRMYPYRKELQLERPIDKYLEQFISEYNILTELCDSIQFVKNSKNQEYFQAQGYGEFKGQVIRLVDLMRQAHLDPFEVLKKECEYHGIIFNDHSLMAVAVSKKYEGYIKRAEAQNDKMKNLDNMKVCWEGLTNSKNISFECRQRIARIRPETFGQLRLIEGIRAATLAIAAGKLY